MSKTIYDLHKDYDAAYVQFQRRCGRGEWDQMAAERAGIRAVVAALRDEMIGVSRLRDVQRLFEEILGTAGGKAAADAISQKEGEVHDGRISQSLSTIGAPRNEVAGRHQGPSRGAIQHDSGNPDNTGNFTGEDETGRSGDVGCEIGHSLNEKVADGADRKDAHAQLGSQQAHTPAADPSDGVAQRIEHGVSTSDVAGSSPAAVATDPAPDVCEWTFDSGEDSFDDSFDTACGGMWVSVHNNPKQDGYNFCPSCGKPISFKAEAK